jgi:hypothetical protein
MKLTLEISLLLLWAVVAVVIIFRTQQFLNVFLPGVSFGRRRILFWRFTGILHFSGALQYLVWLIRSHI